MQHRNKRVCMGPVRRFIEARGGALGFTFRKGQQRMHLEVRVKLCAVARDLRANIQVYAGEIAALCSRAAVYMVGGGGR